MIAPAHIADAFEIAPRLREADLLECRDLGIDPLDMAVRLVQMSPIARAWVVDDQVQAIFGLSAASFASHSAEPWVLATDYANKHPIRFLRGSREVCRQFLGVHPYMHGLVAIQRREAKRWLDWLGFRCGKPKLVGSIVYLTFEMGVA